MVAVVRTLHVGIGAIGAEVVRLIAQDHRFRVVGAVDSDPGKAGRDLGEVAGLGRRLGVTVMPTLEEALRDSEAQVLVHTAGSRLAQEAGAALSALSHGLHVLSTCEELSFPWARHPDLARRLDEEARARGLRVLGAGVNPGFVMDLLPSLLAAACQRVDAVRVRRVVDLSRRRPQLQRKMGVGLSPQEFEAQARAGALGHVGLLESALMLADALGWELEELREEMVPVLAPRHLRAGPLRLEAGQVAGACQTVTGLRGGMPALELTLVMALEASDPHDAIEIDGEPPLRAFLPGGVQGDRATAALVVRLLPTVVHGPAPVGLITVRDLPIVPRRLERGEEGTDP
ncbi:MAG TPA: dihydrodipicolinate reductase [Dehalococcoidia bacterium]|nr:dihydrodipicolinate reductase [Dehalococcoidia bacterium]